MTTAASRLTGALDTTSSDSPPARSIRRPRTPLHAGARASSTGEQAPARPQTGLSAAHYSGGEGGIRTLGTGLSPYTRLAGEHLRPLGHLSFLCARAHARALVRATSCASRIVIAQMMCRTGRGSPNIPDGGCRTTALLAARVALRPAAATSRLLRPTAGAVSRQTCASRWRSLRWAATHRARPLARHDGTQTNATVERITLSSRRETLSC